MDTITSYVEELLHRYECVIIPDFGAFLSKRNPARICKSTGVCYPPFKSIGFNKQLQNHDGLLVSYIASATAKSYAQVLRNVQQYVTEIEEEFSLNGRVVMGNIGFFVASKENKMQFQPADGQDFLLESFGFSELQLLPLAPPIQDFDSVANPNLSQNFTSFLPKKTKRRHWLRAAAAITALIGFSFAWNRVSNPLADTLQANRYFSTSENKNQAMPKMEQASLEPYIALPKPIADSAKTEIDSTLVRSNRRSNPRYHIIAGAYRIKENAENKVKELNRKGYDSRILNKNKFGLYQVSFYSYNKKSIAIAALHKIKKESNTHAWLLVKSFSE